MLKKIFISIREGKGSWWKISEKNEKKAGKQLEENFVKELKRIEFTRLDKEELINKEKKQWEKLKKEVQKKEKNELITNNFSPSVTNGFVYSPYGSQNYPDFLFFTSKYIIPVELKSSKVARPVWNSHLPRKNGLYIFVACGEKSDITFFRGVDVIDKDLSNKLIGFFEKARKTEEDFIESLKEKDKSERGWKPYIRIAYDQAKSLLTSHGKLNYFEHPRREEIENKVLEWLEDKD